MTNKFITKLGDIICLFLSSHCNGKGNPCFHIVHVSKIGENYRELLIYSQHKTITKVSVVSHPSEQLQKKKMEEIN